MKKRILALVLSVAMVLSFLPFAAFADDTEAANLNEIAILKVPDSTDKLITDNSPVVHPVVRQENGENFIVYDGNAFGESSSRYTSIATTAMTYGEDANGLPLPEDVTSADLANYYIAVRIKAYDNGVMENDYAALRIFINRNKVLSEDGETVIVDSASNRLSSKTSGYAMYWLDANDGSMINAYNTPNTENGTFGFTGNLDGWLLIPSGTEDSGLGVAETHYKYLRGLQFYFHRSTSGKQYNWENIEFLVGDMTLVASKEQFQADKIKELGLVKYAPNKGEDGAYYAMRAFGARHYQNGVFGKSVTKDTSTNQNAGSGTPIRGYLHKTNLLNGEAAYALTLNTSLDYTAGGGSVTMVQTYEESWGGYRAINDGIPADIDLSKINAVAYRVATKDGTVANETVNFRLEPRRSTSADSRSVSYGTLAEGTVTYIDALTGDVSTLPVAADGSITVTGNIDGWIIAGLDQYGTFFLDAETNKMKEIFYDTWGGNSNATTSATVTGTSMSEGLGFYLNSGFEHGKTLYLGDMLFLEDAKVFEEYRTDCAKVGHNYAKTAEEAPTCTADGSITYTCQRTACTDKTYVETIPALDHKWVEAAGDEPTCTTDGFVESYCERDCGVEPKIDVIPATGKHIASETATPAGDDINHNYICEYEGCTEVVSTEACTYVEDETQRVEAQIGVAGKKVFICSVCGDEKEEEIPPLEPTCEHANTEIVGKTDAECGKPGYTGDKVCADCGEELEKGQATDALVHDQDTVVPGYAAQCGKEGLTDGAACSKCGAVQVAQEPIDALEHTVLGDTVKAKELCGNGCGTVLFDFEAELKTGNVTLEKNILLDKAIVIDYTTVINLNGKTIALTTEDKSGDGIFWVKNGGNLTINGEGVLDAAGNDSGYKMALWADGGKITINGGTYTNACETTHTQLDLIYVKNGGVIEINGGTFISATPRWTLNSHNTAKGNFIINGGKFYQYNPSDIDTDEGFASWIDEAKYDAVADGEYFTLTAHVCDYKVKEVVAPTATEAGYTIYACKCGKEYKADYTMPTDSEVKNVQADQITDTMNLKVTWDAIEGADMYLVYVYDAEGKQVRGATITNGKNYVRINGFEVGTYTVKVRARVGGKYTANYAGVEIAMGSILPESPVVTVVETSKDSITVTWAAVEGAQKYFVEFVGGGQRFAPALVATPDAITETLTFEGLKVDTEYQISVCVKLGDTVYTDYGVQTAAKTDAHAEIALTAEKTADGVLVAWNVSNNDGEADMYWVRRVDAEGNKTLIAATSENGIIAKDVEGANSFNITARVKDKYGIYRYITTEVVAAE